MLARREAGAYETGVHAMAHPEYVPQLATLVTTPPSGRGWCHEIKFDGYRIGCRIRNGRVTLITRNGKDWTAAFPEIADAARALPTRDALLDGEVAVLLPDGRTSFQALQHAAPGAARAGLVYFAFDLLHLDGVDVASHPLSERKALLATLVTADASRRLRYSEHVEGPGSALLAEARRLGLEGIVSKRLDQPYRPGRNRDWVKAKCARRQAFVVGGFTDPEGTRAGLGALLIGCYAEDRLVFAGKVGTGFTHEFALDLRRQLDAIAQPATPFDPPPTRAVARRAHWVAPSLVCDVSFTEWTGDGMIRHPSFQGLREDVDPRNVRRADDAAARTPTAPRPTPDVVAGVRLTHPDREFYPEPRLTKIELAHFYERIARWIVPHLAGRPLTLVRCPQGITGTCFYVKHAHTHAPSALRRVGIAEKTGTLEYLVADDVAGVVALVQMGTLEIHTWNVTAANIEHPDRIVVDLDPGERVSWDRTVHAARTVRDVLATLGLESYCKTTGGRGLHVVVPLVPRAGWPESLAFTRALSEALARTDPRAYTTQFRKKGRDDKILIDYLRNSRGSTSVAAYSTRAREGAPVSVPIGWNELVPSLDPGAFTVSRVAARLAHLEADPWDGYWSCRQTLTSRLLRAMADQR
jgi:bifunctional non-homologous end joining protein LigD